MKRFTITVGYIALTALLSACGGGGGGGGLDAFATRFAELDNDPTLASNTSNTTVDGLNGPASYVGVINIGTSDVNNPAGNANYYGDLNLTVNFDNATTDDAITGSAGNFVQFFSTIASPKTGNGVSGSLTINGALTGNNTSGIGDGLTGTATGAIDGIGVSYDMEGNVTGVAGNGLSLFFDGNNAESSGGVGLAIR